MSAPFAARISLRIRYPPCRIPALTGCRAVPFAAGIACIEKMKRLGLPRLLREKGEKLKAGLEGEAKKYGFDLHVSGTPALFYLRIADDPSLRLHQAWIAECVKRGVFFTNHHNHFLNAALSDEDIAETVEIAGEAFATVKAGKTENESLS